MNRLVCATGPAPMMGMKQAKRGIPVRTRLAELRDKRFLQCMLGATYLMDQAVLLLSELLNA